MRLHPIRPHHSNHFDIIAVRARIVSPPFNAQHIQPVLDLIISHFMQDFGIESAQFGIIKTRAGARPDFAERKLFGQLFDRESLFKLDRTCRFWRGQGSGSPSGSLALFAQLAHGELSSRLEEGI